MRIRVKDLMRKLKVMPNEYVYLSAHDQPEWRVDGPLSSVSLIEKQDLDVPELDRWEQESFDEMPKKWVSLHG